MSRVSVDFDPKQFYAACDELTGKNMKKAVRSTLLASSNILRKETLNQFKNNVKSKDGDGKGLDPKSFSYSVNGEKMRKNAALVVIKIVDNGNAAKVHIGRNFKARFFEIGTKERYTKGRRITGKYRIFGRTRNIRSGKGGRRGRIEATHSFLKAQELTKGRIFKHMELRLSKAIIRLWRKQQAAS